MSEILGVIQIKTYSINYWQATSPIVVYRAKMGASDGKEKVRENARKVGAKDARTEYTTNHSQTTNSTNKIDNFHPFQQTGSQSTIVHSEQTSQTPANSTPSPQQQISNTSNQRNLVPRVANVQPISSLPSFQPIFSNSLPDTTPNPFTPYPFSPTTAQFLIHPLD